MFQWQPIVIFAHVFIAISIVALILLQQGKGADAGAAFGAGASGTVFGAKGSSSFLSRATGILATLFFGTSLTLAYFQGDRSVPGGVLQGIEQSTPAFEAPAEPMSDLPAPIELPAADDSAPAPDELPQEN